MMECFHTLKVGAKSKSGIFAVLTKEEAKLNSTERFKWVAEKLVRKQKGNPYRVYRLEREERWKKSR